MDKMEAMLWLATIRAAKKGDKEAQETLHQENYRRIMSLQPTIEDELQEIAIQEQKKQEESLR